MATTLNGLGATQWEVWLIDGQSYIVSFVPSTEPPVPLVWEINDQELAAAFGPTRTVATDRTMNLDTALASGVIFAGLRNELPELDSREGDIWQLFVAEYEKNVAVQPWLADDEILALNAEAWAENRIVTEAELQGTEWWQTHSVAERDWLTLYMSDPATADQLVEDAQIDVRDALLAAGIANPTDGLIGLMANNVVQGIWSETFLNDQIRKLSDPFAPGAIDQSILDLLGDTELDTTASRESRVRDLTVEWIGSFYADGYGEQFVTDWAGRLRNDPDAEGRLVELLRGARQSAFGDYDSDLTYQDIAGPHRAQWRSILGEVPPDSDADFQRLIALNDASQGESFLREVGIKRNNQKVTLDALKGLQGTLGSGIRADVV